jgi:hypothetical protein
MVDPADVLRVWKQGTPEARRLADVFMSADGAGRRYVLGRNEHAAALSQVIEVDAFVDDFVAPGSTWYGKPVITGAGLPAHGIVANCSMAIGPVSAEKRLAGLSQNRGRACTV